MIAVNKESKNVAYLLRTFIVFPVGGDEFRRGFWRRFRTVQCPLEKPPTIRGRPFD